MMQWRRRDIHHFRLTNICHAKIKHKNQAYNRMPNFYGNNTPLTKCVDDKLYNTFGSRFPPNYPKNVSRYNAARNAIKYQCMKKLGYGPSNPRKVHQTQSRLSELEGRKMNAYNAEKEASTYGPGEEQYQPRSYAPVDPTLNRLPPSVEDMGPNNNLTQERRSGSPPKFAGFGFGGGRGRRHSRTRSKHHKKLRRRQTRRKSN